MASREGLQSNLGAQSGLHVSPITALLRSTQLSGTCGEMPPRRPRCLGLHLTCDSYWLMVKQGCWKSGDQGHQFRYHMTRKHRDAFPSGLHRDAFQLDNMHAVGSGLESRRVYAGQLLAWMRNAGIATRFPAEY
jgi:hypothetical protein